SAALVISDIPLVKPIGGVRVGFVDGNYVVNPTIEEQKRSRLDLMLAGTEDAILMIEGYADFLTEEQILEAVEEGHQAIRKICQALGDWQKEIGKQKIAEDLRLIAPALIEEVQQFASGRIDQALRIKEKQVREDTMKTISEELVAKYAPETEAEPK